MKIIINGCFGGYHLSHKAVMRFAELSGFQLFPFTEIRDANGNFDFDKFTPYQEGDKVLMIHYSTKPLTPDGKYEGNSYWNAERQIERTNPILIQVVEELGEQANGDCAELKVIEIPDDIEYEIDEYDGIESVHEAHRSWS